MAEEGSSGTSRSSRTAPSGSKGRRAEGSQSPVVYREKPLDYLPARLCYCKEKAPRWISWSDENPGRRYYTCKAARAGGCGFWQWHNPETPPFLNLLLLDLRDNVWGLKKENAALKRDKELDLLHPSDKELDLETFTKSFIHLTKSLICFIHLTKS